MYAHSPSLNALWDRARAMLGRALNAIGAPLLIAALAYVPLEQRRMIRAWFARLEHITRKLLLAEAATLAPLPAPRRRARRATRSGASRRRGFIIISRRSSDHYRGRVSAGRKHDHAKHLAARLAALQQVMADPAPAARRLAQRLQRAPAQALRLAAAPSRSVFTDAADARLPIDATGIAITATQKFRDTS